MRVLAIPALWTVTARPIIQKYGNYICYCGNKNIYFFKNTGNAELNVFALTITGWMKFHSITIHSPDVIQETILSLIRSLIPIF